MMPVSLNEMFLVHIRSLVWAWDALAFGATAFLIFRARARGGEVWGGRLTGLLALDLALMFAMQDRTMLRPPGLMRFMDPFDVAEAIHDILRYAIPALLAHIFYREERVNLPAAAVWRACVAALYAVAACQFLARILRFVSPEWRDWREFGSPVSIVALGASSVLVSLIILQTRHVGSGSGKRKFYQLMGPMFSAIVVLNALELTRFTPWLSIVQDLIPASLLLVLAYYVQPLTLDILIKEVTFCFFALAAVFSAWWMLPPIWLITRRTGVPVVIAGVWVAITAAPWLHRQWVRWLDRVLLGRRLTATEARAFFLAGLEGAITQADLARSAERTLCGIFGAPARVSFEEVVAVKNSPGMRAGIRAGDELCGWIEVDPRTRSLQFLSEDVELLASLAGQFSILFDNLRLRERKLEQERREKDLQILATRAELKALRVQINPHFLFNSLSAIAGLISKDGPRARETVERLAEIFRYTLSRSHKEWVHLEEELEFVTTYLEIERARFGSRLQVEIRVDQAARLVLVPSMVLQIMVENAIKHGISSVRGAGVVMINGQCSGQRLLLEVRDNGPGIQRAKDDANGNGSGFGLRNIQDRLQLCFGDGANLRLSRAGSMTSVSIDMPAGEPSTPMEGSRV